MTNKPKNNADNNGKPNANIGHNNDHNGNNSGGPTNPNSDHDHHTIAASPNQDNNRSELIKSLSEFFRRDLITIPVVKNYPHSVIQQKCGLRAATLELDTAAYPNIEYVAGTRLSVYPVNPASQVQAIMDYLIDDLAGVHAPSRTNIALPPNSNWWAKFVQVHKGDSLRLALTHLFDIMTAPTRDTIKLLLDNEAGRSNSGSKNKESAVRKKYATISSSNEAWEKWLCTGHRTLKSLMDELCRRPTSSSSRSPAQSNQKVSSSKGISALRLLSELEVQTPRQYSISNIKSSKRFRTEIIVFQHSFNLRQIELNLRQLRERETFDRSITSPKSPTPSQGFNSANLQANQQSNAPAMNQSLKQIIRRASSSSSSPATRAASSATSTLPIRNVAESSERSGASMRSIRSLAPFVSSPPISTHQVKRVPSFSGPLMSAYATAATSSAATSAANLAGQENSRASRNHERVRSRMSQLSAPDLNFSDQTGQTATAASSPQSAKSAGSNLFDGLCSNYLLNLKAEDKIVCEFVENPRFTLKGNRERPIMMIGQDVGLIAFRPFWQQRNLEHDRAQVFYTLFRDLSPKKFGEMQLICITGHKCRIEELLFKREINLALTSKIISSVTYINRKHLVGILSAAHTKSQLVFAQYGSTTAQKSSISQSGKSITSQQQQQASQSNANGPSDSLQITNKELLDLGDRIYKLLVENNGCLYTCCDPHMTQAIEILTFESIARNNPQLTRERIMQLLPKWKGKDTSTSGGVNQHSADRSRSKSKKANEQSGSVFTLENTYERARIVQEIYENSI